MALEIVDALPHRWTRDVAVENAALDTTGGKVWAAAHELCRFLERRWDDLGFELGASVNILEIGAGCGWLGQCVAHNVCGANVTMTEQEAGLEHLENNIQLNRSMGKRVQAVHTASLDWSACANNDLLSQRWDLVIGSDLLYTEQTVNDLPALFRRVASTSTRVFYAHTLHRYDHLDVEFFKAISREGLECLEVGDVADCEEVFLKELFPEERPAVFEIYPSRGGKPPLLPKARGDDDSDAVFSAPKGNQDFAASDAISPAEMGFRIILPNSSNDVIPEETHLLPLRLDVVGPFGNAAHPTTRLVLRWAASPEGQAALKGQPVCDYGCGSGILGIAAMLHGASSCASVDNDIAALAATKANAGANDVHLNVRLPPSDILDRDIDFYSRFGDWRNRSDNWKPLGIDTGDFSGASCRGQFSVVLCNIVVGPLCAVSSTLYELCCPGGHVVLAGFRGGHMRGQVEKTYGHMFDLVEAGREDGWQLLVGRRVADSSAN